MKYIFFILIFVSFSILCMDKQEPVKNIDFRKIYDQFKAPAMQLLTEEEKQAINDGKDNAKIINALPSLARLTVDLTYKRKFLKTLSQKKLEKKSFPYARYMIENKLS